MKGGSEEFGGRGSGKGRGSGMRGGGVSKFSCKLQAHMKPLTVCSRIQDLYNSP